MHMPASSEELQIREAVGGFTKYDTEFVIGSSVVGKLRQRWHHRRLDRAQRRFSARVRRALRAGVQVDVFSYTEFDPLYPGAYSLMQEAVEQGESLSMHLDAWAMSQEIQREVMEALDADEENRAHQDAS
jgi:hypothetical protein